MSVSPIGSGGEIPTPPRPLGPEGLRVWNRVWTMPVSWINPVLDLEHVTILCEAMDERSALRLRVFQANDRLERVALRNLETIIIAMLAALGLNPADRKSIGQGGGGASVAATRLAELRRKATGHG